MSQAPTDRTRVHRHPERADYDSATIHRVLDESLLCTVPWVDKDGQPRALPTIQARIDDASAKVRRGPPLDDDADLDLEVWAGTLPL